MKAIAVLLILFWTSSVAELFIDRMIIWNVGQGLWVTIVSLDSCTHVDMGGEKVDWKKVAKVCGNKTSNKVVFSHWDLDHISFAERASRQLPGFCVATPPRGPATPQKTEIFARFLNCPESSSREPSKAFPVSEIKFAPTGKKIKANDMSRVYLGHSTLFPGDSTAKQERIWSRFILPQNLKYLVLGHHGSKTSTSLNLLKKLPQLQLAIASARKKRYGHPHRSVVKNLRDFGVATLSTEQWNNIVIELK